MTKPHPITPPPELVGQWYNCATAAGPNYLQEIADRSAQWGADQELEACCEWPRYPHNKTYQGARWMTDLSPQAQQVLDAYLRAPVDNRLSSVRQKLAAALLAAADQVVPEEPEGGMAPRWIRQEVRRQFRAIAAELAGTPTTPAES